VKRVIYLSIVAALAGSVWYAAMADAQAPAPPVQPATQPAAQPMRPRIALVNIAKVLREFQKATADGKIISSKRQYYVDLIKPRREALAAKSRLINQTPDPIQKEKMQKEALALNREIEDIDQEAQRVLGEMTDRMILEVYSNIKSVINDVAVTNNLDLVMCYPDASSVEDEKKPQVAQLKLQTPALTPFYHRGMDITQVVVDTLNRRHPAPPTPSPNISGAAPTPGSVQPTPGSVPPSGAPVVQPVGNYPPKQ
jgi:Skp family chaperone for outer membrane proteins